MNYMKEKVLNDLAHEVFELLENSDRSDLTDRLMEATTMIRNTYLNTRNNEKSLREAAKQADCDKLHDEIQSLMHRIDSFPETLKKSKNVHSIIDYLTEIESAAKKCVSNQRDEDGDDKQSMKFRFAEAMVNCGSNEELKGYLVEAFLLILEKLIKMVLD